MGETAAVTRSREASTAAEARLRSARTGSRTIEDELAANRAKQDESERRLYGGSVHNPKELQDLQAEVEALSRHRGVLEDRLLNSMLVVEEAKSASLAAQADLDRTVLQAATQGQALTLEQTQLSAQVERLSAEREAAVGDVTEGDLALYSQLRDNRAGHALALVQDDACGACGLIVAHSLRQEIRQGTSLIRCIQCGRILYAG